MFAVTFDSLRTRLSSRTPRTADTTGRAQAAVAIVLAPAMTAGLDVLFIKRAEVAGDPWSGQMAFPGGRREVQDADLLETARRETHEETGISLASESVLGVLDDLAPTTPTLPPVLVRPFVFGVANRPNVFTSAEVSHHLWTPLGLLPSRAGRADIVIGETRRVMPAYLIGPHVVWGMTHRIIRGLLDLAL